MFKLIPFKVSVGLFIILATVKAHGDFVVLHSPNSVLFNGNEEVEQSLLKEVLAAALGFTVKLRGVWSGISITDPFSLPEAVVAIAIEGVDSLDIPRGKKYPLNVNEVEETTWQALRERLEERDNNNTLVRISLGDGLDALGQSALGELKPTPIDETSLTALNLRSEEDRKYLEEVQLLHAIANKAPSAIKPDSRPDIYWLVVSGLRPVFDAHGSNSTSSREALTLLNNALNVIHDAFIQAYDGQVLIVAFTNDASQVHSLTLDRHKRQAVADSIIIKNLAKDYSDDYPVIFNILLWFSVVFWLSLLAISITIAQMDPGRDSIIYRMTSNRMKKDN
ncbi:renin receptor isoform X2 [Ceratina calcarata]|uniref:Renin receptor isoform X2 n=1 Tax=Ceratina calcarata TaxID=156304 RepID=A0AAJ7JB76_9HYME|nr:renin receptor isoform X2 [Ceratina calcarata]